ncbi:2-phosphosulfolactate phosphatase [Pelatocladus sp. BLCC-F211]|uniref:2-phosphosulfolactate phosphatase n=1 Tax=Pelatocladus sp. BLCC-F211 TaxID=3342752 RepID=UPI0035B8A3CF
MIFNQSEFDLEIAVSAFHAVNKNLLAYFKKSSSGKELIARGFESDVEIAAALNVSDCVPLFVKNAYLKQIV